MQGIIAAVPTPVDDTGRPLREPFLDHARWALGNGCDGLNILGSTGEATSFDAAARGRIMEWAAEGLDRARLMVGTGTPSLAETVALTERADDLGYGVALVLPPFYYTPPSADGLVRWYEALHRALGNRPIRIYFYNFPAMTGFPVPVEVMARLHAHAPERFAGIKDSSNDLEYCRAVRAALPSTAKCVRQPTLPKKPARSMTRPRPLAGAPLQPACPAITKMSTGKPSVKRSRKTAASSTRTCRPKTAPSTANASNPHLSIKRYWSRRTSPTALNSPLKRYLPRSKRA